MIRTGFLKKENVESDNTYCYYHYYRFLPKKEENGHFFHTFG
jgi:hypothetical protein